MRRIVYKVYLAACAMALLVASSTFAQTLDYSNCNASYEIIGSDTAMIKVTVEGVAFNFVKVEGGDVNLGPFGRQHLDTFWMMETEVTYNLFSKFYNSANKSSKECVDYSQSVYSKMYTDYGEMPLLIYDDYDNYDSYVNNKPSTLTRSRNVVGKVVDILNNVYEQFTFSLPTAQQWLYAARGGSISGDYTYSGSDNIDEVAWYVGNSRISVYRPDVEASERIPHQVKQKNPNELGLYDMCGNAAEVVDAEIFSSRMGWWYPENSDHGLDGESYLIIYSHVVCCGGDAKTDADKCHPSLAEQRQEFMTFRLVLVPKQ
ncbi:MAG: SUMF1/EgtB/PvdO family nonheme iron enzyme [Muribaculaceae bacterium]|nr:SUMF1/EgtB/PvdO family nonheme iron enzyme [Muribaculaceae bacterium]